ncbi:sodium:solute symporter family protein [Ellagibacter isourolithinifaciens]|uniref:sodium:solute symporter family protein n=1 Tax=Ellagibacter isourolithinifaciens TaxID=2137581 RepID=UPI003FD70004
MAVMLGMLGVFFLGIIVVLYLTLKKSKSFDEYAVGGRSFGPWFVAMSYVNSWWPGTVFISFAGLSVASGVFGFYGLAYSTLGLAAMYFIASRAWRWGKHYNLVTQPDLLRLRYGSKAVGVVTSIIGVIAILPWVILGMQALATVFSIASGGTWALPVCLLVGLATVLIRQIWTVRMGMRGLVYTDMYQGIVAYVIAAIVCVLLLVAPNSPANWSYLSEIPNQLLFLPGDGDSYGPLYMFSSVFTGVVGALCWPMSFVRIYTANNVKSVKKSTNYAMLIAGGFYALLTIVMLSAAHITGVAANPQAGWTTLLENYGGVWLLGLGLTMIFAGSIGHIDGSVQAAGTQIANDIVGSKIELSDVQKTIVSKGSMVLFIALAAVLAYFTNGMDRLQLLAQISYQAVVQISVPLFLGIFFKFGNKNGALAGMIVGFVVAAALTIAFPDDIPALGSITGGVVALFVNLFVYVAVSLLTTTPDAERTRVDELFDVARGGKRSTVTVGAAVPGMATAAKGESAACEAATSVATCEDAAATAMAESESEGLAASKAASIATAAPSLREAAAASYARAGGAPAEASAS